MRQSTRVGAKSACARPVILPNAGSGMVYRPGERSGTLYRPGIARHSGKSDLLRPAGGEPMLAHFTRRDALKTLASVGALSRAGTAAPAPIAGAPAVAQAGGLPSDQNKRWRGSALGNLYPFIKEEQQRTRQRLAFLNRLPKDLEAWKVECREKVFAALTYRPEACKPEAGIIDRVDKGDYIRERLKFHTAPSVEVPAYLLIPKRAKFPAPAVVALHD